MSDVAHESHHLTDLQVRSGSGAQVLLVLYTFLSPDRLSSHELMLTLSFTESMTPVFGLAPMSSSTGMETL